MRKVKGGLVLAAALSCAGAWIWARGEAGFTNWHGETFSRRGAEFVAADPSMVRQAFPTDKGPAVFRVFLLGGSQAMGTPFALKATPFWWSNQGCLADWLKSYLQALMPGREIEVVNAARAAMDTATAVDLFGEIAEKGRPDLVIVLSGDNERAGIRGRRPGLPFELEPGADLDKKVRTLARGLEQAIQRTARQAEERRIRTYFLTVPDNLRDFAPEDSRELYQQAQDYEKTEDYLKAREYYVRAKDQDRNFGRCRSLWNKAFLKAGRGRFVRAFDLESRIFAHAEHGIPGFDLFLDFCHLNLKGNRWAAYEIARFFAQDQGVKSAESLLKGARPPELSRLWLRFVYRLNAYKWKRYARETGLDEVSRSNALAVAANYLGEDALASQRQ